MAPSSSGLGHLAFIQVIAGSTPAGVTFEKSEAKSVWLLVSDIFKIV